MLGLHEKLEGETSLFRKMNCIRRDIEEYTFVLTCSQIFLSLLQNFSIGSTHMYSVSDLLLFDMDHKNRKQCTTPGGGEISPFLTGVKKYKTSTKRTAQSHCQTSCKTAVVTPPRTSNLRSISYWIIGSGPHILWRCPSVVIGLRTALASTSAVITVELSMVIPRITNSLRFCHR